MPYTRSLYILFFILALIIFFFSTATLKAKSFLVDKIEVSEKLENNFNKDQLINEGFKKAFEELINTLVKSSDLKKINKTTSNEIKSMIESFSIKEEKFINKEYYLNLGVKFNKKKVFSYLEKNNVFPTQIIKKTFLFIPIIIDEKENDLLVYSNNSIYKNWDIINKKSFLINYLLPTEDLEDLNKIKEKFSILENYDFNEIIEKYFLEHSVVALIFQNKDEIKVLSKIFIKDQKIIRNDSFKNFNFDDLEKTKNLISELKIIYEDLWKDHNQINTSIKLPLLIQVDNQNLKKSLDFEKILNDVDLINNYSVNKFDKNFIFYEIIFNGTPKSFINIMSNKNYNFDTQKKIWILK